MSKEYCYSNWRDEFNPTEYKFIDLVKPDPIKILDEGKKKGLWANIHAKRKRGEKPAKPGEKGYPETLDIEEGLMQARKNVGASKCWNGYKAKGTKKKDGKEVPNCVKEEEKKDHEYSMARSEISTLQNAAKRLKKKMGKKGEGNLEAWVQSKITKAADYLDTAADYVTNEEVNINEIHSSAHTPHEVPSGDIKKLAKKAVKRIDTDVDGDTDHNDKAKGELGEFIPGVNNKRLYSSTRTKTAKESFSNWREELGEDWQAVNKKDKTDGMSQKAVDTYRRENPGSKLKTAVTGDPKPGSKDAKRRKSFCARSEGQQDMHNIDCSKDPDKAICKARRRWKC